MKRLTLRLSDATMTALRRELDTEREFRGRRYSLNDLCSRKLSGNLTPERRFDNASSPSTVAGLSRVPPPPPVPMRAAMFLPTATQQVPMPESFSKPNSDGGLRVTDFESEATRQDSDLIAGSNPAPPPDSNESAMFEQAAVESFEDEGGHDGHLDH